LRDDFRNRSVHGLLVEGGFFHLQPSARLILMAVIPTTLTNHQMLLILCARIGYSPHDA
jgi:hypothetical protein